ncbi:MAG: GTPase Era [Gammaproteobacteria bacterium]
MHDLENAGEDAGSRCGYVAIVGRPNVGKSTLVNRILGHKLCITSRRPQTTRHRILGIKSTGGSQLILVDTPGMHSGRTRALNRYLNRTADGALLGVDLAVMLVEALKFERDDQRVLERVVASALPCLLAINKVDQVSDKQRLLPFLADIARRHSFDEIVPIAARQGTGVQTLERLMCDRLPLREPEFDPDQLTDRSMRFVAAELVREQLIRRLGQELPHRLSVEIERYDESGPLVRIDALIWVESRSQKPIVVGRRGEQLKRAGTEVRSALESMTGKRVDLRLWVKVQQGWTDDERALNRLGYVD